MKDHRPQTTDYGLRTKGREAVMKRFFCGAALLLALAMPILAQGFQAEGVTEPQVDEQLSTVIRGLVGQIHVKEGDAVKKGDIIMELRKELETLEAARRKAVWESKAELNAAAERVNMVKQDLDSTSRLYHSTRSISKEKLLEKELEHKLALADLERKKVAEKIEEFDYKIAKEQLRQREIRSPIDGVVTKIFLHVGEIAEPGQPLVRVVDTKNCQFISHLEARAARDLHEGDKVRLEVEAGELPVIVDGKISFVSPTVDGASGLQEIKVKFDNSKGEIRPGVSARMYLNGGVRIGMKQ